jgi:hypothetical protein
MIITDVLFLAKGGRMTSTVVDVPSSASGVTTLGVGVGRSDPEFRAETT